MAADQTQASLVALNGQFLFSWTDFGAVASDTSGSHVGARLFTNAVGYSDPFVANTTFVNGNQFESSLAALADGRLLVVWTNGDATPGAPDVAPNAVYGQIFDPRTEAVTLVGIGTLNNEWVGTGFADAMDGAAGNDRIDGAGGNDNLFGGFGQDTLIGGLAADKLFGNADADTLDGGAGTDGLDGGTGADLMRGGAGNDTYFVDNPGDVVNESGGSGTDLVRSSRSFSLADTAHVKGNVEQLILLGNGNLNGAGNGLSNIITGNTGKNTLNGGLGNDRLNGGAGADRLVGGKGNDTFFVDSKLDRVVEANNGGLDQVLSTVTFSLAGQFAERLTLTGVADRNGTGNGLNNLITGNASKNTLSGVAGNDQLNGGGGIDTLIGGVGNDKLNGGAGNDKINGGVGRDLLTGSTGNDSFIYKTKADSRGATADVIRDFDDLGNDRIDLSAFAGKLAYKGLDAFTGIRQVHIKDIAGPDVLVEVNLAGSVAAEMVIRLAGTTAASMTIGDFLL